MTSGQAIALGLAAAFLTWAVWWHFPARTCKWCNRTYDNGRALRRHLRERHVS